MPTVSFVEPLYLFAERGYQPRVQIKKEGFGPAEVKVYATGNSVTYQQKYPDRAIKRSTGDFADFHSRTETLQWDESEEGIKEYEIIIHADENEGEAPEYFYVTLKPADGVDAGFWRCHCFILDGDGSEFFNKYLVQPYMLKQNEIPIPIGEKRIEFFGLEIQDTNGDRFPDQLLTSMFSTPGFFGLVRNGSHPLVKNVCEVQDVGPFTIFNGEFHVEYIDVPSSESIRHYNQSENAQYSQYSHVYVTLPIANPTDMPIPLTLSCSQFWNFRDMHTDERQEQVNGSMTAMLLPRSSRVMFEFSKGAWKTALCGFWSENNPPTFKPSLHIFLGGLIPNS